MRALGRIRTCDARFRKPTLYPLSYEGIGYNDAGYESTGAIFTLGRPARSERVTEKGL